MLGGTSKFHRARPRLKSSEASHEWTRHRHLLGLQIAIYAPPINSSVLQLALPIYQSPSFGP